MRSSLKTTSRKEHSPRATVCQEKSPRSVSRVTSPGTRSRNKEEPSHGYIYRRQSGPRAMSRWEPTSRIIQWDYFQKRVKSQDYFKKRALFPLCQEESLVPELFKVESPVSELCKEGIQPENYFKTCHGKAPLSKIVACGEYFYMTISRKDPVPGLFQEESLDLELCKEEQTIYRTMARKKEPCPGTIFRREPCPRTMYFRETNPRTMSGREFGTRTISRRESSPMKQNSTQILVLGWTGVSCH